MASWLSLDSLDSTIARCDRSGPPPPSPLPGPLSMGQACCRRHIVKIDTNDIYNQRTYSFSFKDSQVVDKNQEYSTMEEDYTYDNMPQDEGTSAKVGSLNHF